MRTRAALVNIQALSPAICALFAAASTADKRVSVVAAAWANTRLLEPRKHKNGESKHTYHMVSWQAAVPKSVTDALTLPRPKISITYIEILYSLSRLLLRGPDFSAFAGERPVLIEQQFFLALGSWNLIDRQVLEKMNTAFTRNSNVEVTVAVQVLDDESRTGACCAVNGHG